jgi:hypothetical protein
MENAVDNMNADEFNICFEYLRKLNSNYFDPFWVDVIIQKWKYKFDIYDAHAFSKVWHLLMTGKVAYAIVGIIETPSKDKYEDINNKKLSYLAKPFRARFSGGPGGGCDGSFTWEESIICSIGHNGVIVENYKVEPQSIALEAGGTKAERTFFHLCCETGVARWPYGHDRITVMIPTNEYIDERLSKSLSPPTRNKSRAGS